MFDGVLAFLVPLVALAIIFAWVPLLNLICPPCRRSLQRQRDSLEVHSFMGSIRD